MIYSWDISTSITGVSTFDPSGSLVETSHIDLRELEGVNVKAAVVRKFMVDMGVGLDSLSDVHVVEEKLSNFAPGRSSMQTMMLLAQFNAVVSYIISQEAPGALILRLHPSTWKSIMRKEGLLIPPGQEADKKKITLAYVRAREPDFDQRVRSIGLNRNDNPHPWCFDEADSYCLGKAGFRVICRENASSAPSAAPSTTRAGSGETEKRSSSVRIRKGAKASTTSGSSP